MSQFGVNTYLRKIYEALLVGGGSSGPAANVGVLDSVPTRINPSTIELQRAILANGGIPGLWRVTTAITGYAVDDYVFLKNVSQGNTANYQWHVINADGTGATANANPLPAANREPAGGSSTSTSSGSSLQAYQIDGEGTVLYGEVDNAAGTITPLGGGAAIAIGTGTGEAQLVPSSDVEIDRRYTATAPDRAPDYVAGNELLRLIQRQQGGAYSIAWLNADTGAFFETAPVNPTPEATGGAGVDFDPVAYDLNDGTIGRGWFDQSTQVLYADIDRATAIPIGSNPTDAIASSIQGVIGERATEQSVTTFTLNSQDEVLAPVPIPTGRKLVAFIAAIKVENYASATNSVVTVYPETSFFPTGASDEFEITEEGSQAPAQGNTVGHTGSDSGALEGVTFIRLRREDSSADITADISGRLILTLR